MLKSVTLLTLSLGVASMAYATASHDARPAEGHYADIRIEFAFSNEARVTLLGEDFKSSMKWDYTEVESLLSVSNATAWQRLFYEHTPSKLDELRKTGEARRGIELPDLNNWFTATVADEETALDLVKHLGELPYIRSAAVTPLPELNTPDYEGNQDYHDDAPYGVGIADGWAEAGGTGNGIRVMHHEGGWITDHEDLTNLNHTGGGNEYPGGDSGWYDHGTACVSIMGASNNGFGVTGLVYNVDGLYSRGFWDNGSPNTWLACMDYLNPGDVISASWGYGGNAPPGQTCICNCGQFGGQPAESNQSDFDAIQTVTANGYIVVNSASNGSVPMDDASYNNMYDLNTRDSGALLIGAAQPGGVPECWTNHGSRVDAYAWGSSIYSAGYGDLYGSGSTSYTSSFGGTSGACPIVSGAIASLQGIYKNNNGDVLDAWELRNLLRTTGTDQTGDFSKVISNMPDLSQLIAAIGGGGPDVTPPVITHIPLDDTTDQTGPYTVQSTISDVSGISTAMMYYRVNGASWISQNMSGAGSNWSGTIPGQTEGSVIEYYIQAADAADPSNSGTSETWSFSVIGDFDGIVVLSPSGSAYSDGLAWESAFAAAGYEGEILNVDDLDDVQLGANTDALVVLLGIYSNNHTIPDGSAMALSIEAYVNAGGNTYMEGGDCWAFDPGSAGGHDFNALFGITGDSDGSGDLTQASGHEILSGTWAYSGENNWIDHLGTAGASLLFSNPDAAYNCGYYQNSARITACASFELAGLSDFNGIVATLFGPALFDILESQASPPELVYNPESIVGQALAGESDSEIIDMMNIGEETLEWSAVVSQNAANLASMPSHEAITLGKGEFDPRPGMSFNRDSGSDAFGYTWMDSNEDGGPVVQFQDITASGTALSMSDDDNQGPFPLGFNFPFYSGDFDEVRVCSNGYLSFTSTATDYSNDLIPTTDEPNNLIAPFWDDLNPASGGTIHYEQVGNTFIVQWTAVLHYGNTDFYTFQVILHSDGSIEFQYADMAGDLESATVGLENADASIGMQILYNAAGLSSNMAIMITPPNSDPTWLSVSHTSGSLQGGSSEDLAVLLDATELDPGIYNGFVQLNTNEPATHLIPVQFTVMSSSIDAPDLSILSQPDHQIQLSWTEVPGATYYVIYRAAELGAPYELLTTSFDTSLLLTHGADELALYRVIAVQN